MAVFRRNVPPSATVPAGAKPVSTPPAAQRPAPPVDSLAGIQEAYWFKRELSEGRWQQFHDFLEAVTDWDERHFYINGLSSISGRPPWLDEWVGARPRSGLPLLFRGSHGINWAWEARGSGRAKSVKEDAWPVFHARLVDADRDLAHAAALDHRDPVPFVRGIWAAMGLSLGKEEIHRRFAEAERRHHLTVSGVYGMVQALARKWSGSHDEMFGFARWVGSQAPDGHPAHKAIALAHLEFWLDQPKESRPAYFLSGPVGAEVHAAADLCVRSPRYAPGKLDAMDRNVFAMCFYLMRDYRSQIDQMRLIGPRITAAPWQYLGSAGRMYQQAWDEALQAVGGSARQQGRPSL